VLEIHFALRFERRAREIVDHRPATVVALIKEHRPAADD
jgi:hypothetical protein